MSKRKRTKHTNPHSPANRAPLLAGPSEVENAVWTYPAALNIPVDTHWLTHDYITTHVGDGTEQRWVRLPSLCVQLEPDGPIRLR